MFLAPLTPAAKLYPPGLNPIFFLPAWGLKIKRLSK